MDVPNGSDKITVEERGNTKISPQRGGARYKANAKNWVITLFEFSETSWKNALVPCSTIANNQHIVGLEKCPKTEKMHLQCFVHFEKKVRAFDKLKLLYPTGHIEVAKGSVKSNIIYCSKDGNYFSSFPKNDYINYLSMEDTISHFKNYYPDGCRRMTLYKHIYRLMFEERKIKPIRDPRQQRIYCDLIFDFVNTGDNFDWFGEHYPDTNKYC